MTAASYRLIHFTPDPFTEARFPLGAVISLPGGRVEVAKVDHLPSAQCLGGSAWARTVQRLHERLDTITSSRALPAAFGPYTMFSEVRAVPSGVEDAAAWVQALLTKKAPAEKLSERAPSYVLRASVGYQFFEAWKVARFVKKTFQPSTDWNGWLAGHRATLHQISHWVPGAESILLMEPVIPDRGRKFKSDLTDIAQKFGAYRCVLDAVEHGNKGRLVAYIPSGGHPDQRAEAKEALGVFAHNVVDTDVQSERHEFLGQIRAMGQELDSQQDLNIEA